MEDRTIRQSQINKKREERRKKRAKQTLKRILLFFLVLAVLTLLVLSLTVFFPIKTIVVRSPEPYTAEQIVEKSGIEKGKNIFLSGREAKEKITTELPFISDIEIKRKLPATIIIIGKKAVPFMCFETEKGYFVCDKNYKLLEVTSAPPENVASVKGCKFKNSKLGQSVVFDDGEMANSAQEILNILKEKDYAVSRLDVTDLANITFEIKDRFIVKLGSAANIENKLIHLDEIVKNINEGLTGSIDLSYWTDEDPRGIFKQGSIK